MRSHSFTEVSQQIVCVAEVPISSTLGGPVSKLLHYRQVGSENPQTIKSDSNWRSTIDI